MTQEISAFVKRQPLAFSHLFVALCLCLVQSLSSAHAQPPPTPSVSSPLDVSAAVRMALGSHPSVEAAHFDVLAAQAAANIQRSRVLPRLDISDTYSLSHASLTLGKNFVPGLGPISTAKSPKSFAANIASVAVSQPLTGLLPLAYAHSSARRLLQAKMADESAARAQLRAAVEQDYLELFEVLALGETAEASERSLLKQVEEAKHEVAAGTLNPTDVLRIEAAAANARQQVLAAEAEAQAARAALLEQLGLGLAMDTTFAEPQSLLAPPVTLDVMAERAQALQRRPELKSSQLAAEAARHHARATTLAMVPEVTVDGSLMHVWSKSIYHNEPAGSLNADVAAVMINAKWNVWSWGSEWYARQEAHARAHAAQARRQQLEREISVEVASRHATYLANASSIEVARARLESADEALRVIEVQVRAGAATTTDLLDVESSRTNARKSLVRAQYAAAKAHVALRLAVGANPEDPSNL